MGDSKFQSCESFLVERYSLPKFPCDPLPYTVDFFTQRSLAFLSGFRPSAKKFRTDLIPASWVNFL